MGPQAWYEWLRDEYFRWKFTAPNRYATTRSKLETYKEDELADLHAIKEQLFSSDKGDIRQCLKCATKIRGLGTAGASGLLALLFPGHFATVDQFVVKALKKIPELPERDQLSQMNPENLTLGSGTLLIQVMRRKAAELNKRFSTTKWTPRKIDMVLWSCERR
jgi:hypothetical protein